MPANDTVCTDIPVQGNNTYVKVTPDLLYLNVGEKVGFRSVNDSAEKSKKSGSRLCELILEKGRKKTHATLVTPF